MVSRHHRSGLSCDTILLCRSDSLCEMLYKKKWNIKGIVYNADRLGNVDRILYFNKGLKYDITFHETGKKLSELEYQVNPKLCYRMWFDENQKLIWFCETTDTGLTCSHSFLGDIGHQGAEMTFYPSGAIKTYTYRVPDSKNKKISLKLRFFPNGKYMEKIVVKDDKIIARQYYKNGMVRSKFVQQGNKTKTYRKEWDYHYNRQEKKEYMPNYKYRKELLGK